MEQRLSPERITGLEADDVFVYGANLAGRPGKGAALQARSWGAYPGPPGGPMGQTYGIPTKGHDLRYPLPLSVIANHVAAFLCHVHQHPTQRFLVTEIGTGLAGYRPGQVAPLFRHAVDYPNIHLPASFWSVLTAQP